MQESNPAEAKHTCMFPLDIDINWNIVYRGTRVNVHILLEIDEMVFMSLIFGTLLHSSEKPLKMTVGQNAEV